VCPWWLVLATCRLLIWSSNVFRPIIRV
jgi:hypothetical protein